jgi:sugar lactone lactonase YvrE
MTDVQTYTDVLTELGEAPLWRDGRLSWIDVTARALWHHREGEAPVSHIMQRLPAAFGWRRGGGMVFAWRNGMALTDADGAPEHEIDCSAVDFAVERFNDGAVDRQGRFWIGSFNPKVAPEAGNLYRVGPDLKAVKMAGGFTMSNGIAWSPDGRTMYFADSRPGSIRAFDFDTATGEIANRRVLIDYAGTGAHPDGITVDAEGCLWVAECEASRIARYDPAGKLVSTLAMPVWKPTSVTFGGPDMRTLYITTMYLGLDAARRAAEPLGGRLFSARPGVAGLPEPMFVEA